MGRLWEIREDYDYDYDERSGHKSAEYHKAFKEGCMHGYKKAMKEFEELDHRYPHMKDYEDYTEYRKMGGRR